jgi:hypothetical protein
MSMTGPSLTTAQPKEISACKWSTTMNQLWATLLSTSGTEGTMIGREQTSFGGVPNWVMNRTNST